MRSPIRVSWALAFLTAATWAVAADPPRPAPKPVKLATRPPVISSHQIDRYDAIRTLQEKVKKDPKSLADWVILGELAQEVALDLPSDQAVAYNKISLNAYEQALALSPNNPGLKAAVQFARDQETGIERFEAIRDHATEQYLAARRRDLAATQYIPTVRVAAPPARAIAPAGAIAEPSTVIAATPGGAAPTRPLPNRALTPEEAAVDRAPPPGNLEPAVSPAPTQTAATDIANFGTRQIYTSPYSTYTYQPLYTPATTTPYTYTQYSSAYYPPNYYVPGEAAVTTQRYLQMGFPDPLNRPLQRVQPVIP